MDKWLLFLSGIIYGKFLKSGKNIKFSFLDIYTLEWSPYKPLDEKESKKLKKWTHLDVKKYLSLLERYEEAFIKGDSEVSIFGSRYTKGKKNIYVQRDVIYPVDCMLDNNKIISFLAPGRETTGILVKEGKIDKTVLGQYEDINFPIYPVSFPKTYNVLMRDGIILKTDVYLPKGVNWPIPTILIRTPYGKRRLINQHIKFVQRGYALVIQDVRGREDSGGEFVPCYNEVDDGNDTLDWIAKQEFSNGDVGTFGASYLGYVQWASYASGNPHLKAIVSLVTSGSAFIDLPRRGGCFLSGIMAWILAMAENRLGIENMVQADWDDLLNIRPISDIPRKALGKKVKFLDIWLSHSNNDEFWQKGDWTTYNPARNVPTFILSGWFDDNSLGSGQALELTNSYAPEMRKVLLGSWNHNANTCYDIHGVEMGDKALRYDLDLLYLDWFNKHLKGKESSILNKAPIEYFTLGDNKWKNCFNWPPESTREVFMYLGGKDIDHEKGELSFKHTLEGERSYYYDPEKPAIHQINMAENEISVPGNYTEEDKRADVLVYETDILKENIVVSGPVYAVLYISSDAPDTDFIIRLCEVDSLRNSIRYSDGVFSAKYHKGFNCPEYLEMGKIYKIPIKMTSLSKCFKKGNRIRVTITSSAKNYIFPNSNTKKGFSGEELSIAYNTIHHGSKYPSCVSIRVEK